MAAVVRLCLLIFIICVAFVGVKNNAPPAGANKSNSVTLYDFSGPDARWQTRKTLTPDLHPDPTAPRYNNSGKLVLRLIEKDGQVYTSHLATLDQPFVFGKFEARMRFKGPKGAHSAFWLQDVKPDHIGGSEVDIIEHFGSDTTLWSNVYWRTPSTMWPNPPAKWREYTKSFNPRRWHVYGLDWNKNRYIFYVDGKEIGRTSKGVSSMPKVIILSLLSSKWEWPRLDRDNLSRYRTIVDWVRVTQ